MSTTPRWEGVGRKPRVHQSHMGLERGIAQVQVVLGQGHRVHHALVVHCARRKGAHVERDTSDKRARIGSLLAQEIQVRLKFLEGHLLGHGNERLHDLGLEGLRSLAEALAVHRHLPPAQQLQCWQGLERVFKDALALSEEVLVLGEEDVPHCVLAGWWKVDVQFLGLLPKKFIWEPAQHPYSIAGIHLAPSAPAVVEIIQNLKGICYDAPLHLTVDAGDQAHTARVLLQGWVVQALSFRGPIKCLRQRGARRSHAK
mmetsp:Transcript_43010/g.103698  ORF Transcript_43010/g.103698 Transcript_43010/m.103698 type:complete len:257 (-) Transcript_43010:52-822(-)